MAFSYCFCRTFPSSLSKEFIAREMRLLNELLYPGIYGSHVRNNLSRLQNIFDMNKLSIPTIMNSVGNRIMGNIVQRHNTEKTNLLANIFHRFVSIESKLFEIVK